MARAFRSLLPLALPAALLTVATAASAQRDGGDSPPITSGVISQATTAAAPKPPPPPVPVNVLAVPFPISGAIDDQIALLVEAGGKALIANVESGNLVGEIKASAADSTGKVVDEFTQPFALDAGDELLNRGGLKLFAVLRVPPGDYKVEVSVVNTETRGHGNREVNVHAPTSRAARRRCRSRCSPTAPTAGASSARANRRTRTCPSRSSTRKAAASCRRPRRRCRRRAARWSSTPTARSPTRSR
jgi:hypothetical protein